MVGTTRITSNQSKGHTRFTLEADVVETQGVGATANKYGRWRVRFYGKAVNTGDSNDGYDGKGTQYLQRNGSTVHAHGGDPFLRTGVKAGATRWYDGPYDVWVNANSQGYWSGVSESMPISMRLDYSTIDTTLKSTLTLKRISQKPGTPAKPTVSGIGSNVATITWKAPTTGGSAITAYDVQYATNSAFTSASLVSTGGSTLSRQLTSLKPAAKYWARVRARTAAGTGDWSSSVAFVMLPVAPPTPTGSKVTPSSFELDWAYGLNTSGSTSGITSWEVRYSTSSTMSPAVSITGIPAGQLWQAVSNLIANTTYYAQVRAVTTGPGPWSPSVPILTLPTATPGLTVSPAPGGRMATLSFTAPGDVSGVTAYQYRYRLQGATTWIGPITAPADVTIQEGLKPGSTYEWQGAAVVGDYVSPWTSTITAKQPQPNTDPGAWFDGSKAATASSTFAWSGTVGKSISTATGKAATGWGPFTAAGTGATGFVFSATGGAFGSNCARAQIIDPPTTGLLHEGTSTTVAGEMAVVRPGFPVEGSLYVSPSKTTAMSAYILFYTSTLSLISAATGPAGKVQPGFWTRLLVDADVPATAAYAAIHWIEAPDGAGYSQIAAGDYIDMDAAQITMAQGVPYFNGSFQASNQWTYSWQGTANASPSVRTQTTTPVSDPLLDPDCDPLPAPPAPPAIDDDCVDLSPQTWFRYWTTIAAEEMPQWQALIPILTLHAETKAVRQVRIRYYPNPFGRDRAILPVDGFCAEQIVSYLPGGYHLTLDGVTQEAYVEAVTEVPGLTPGVLPASQLLYGTGGGPATWPQLTCGTRYELAVDVLADAGSPAFHIHLQTALRW